MEALKIPHYRNYLSGAFLSEIGKQMQIVALAWQIYEMTRNPISLGLIGVSIFLPIILFSLIGGVVVDKTDRRKILILVQSAQAFFSLILFVTTILHLINPGIIYLILILVSTSQSFSIPARQSVMPHLVPKKYFMNAVSLNTLQYQSAIMIGPAVAGFLIGGIGVHAVYFFNSLSFLFFIAALISIKVPFQKHNRGEVSFSTTSIMEGVKFVLKTPILLTSMFLDFLVTFFGTSTILMPVFAKDILGVGAGGLGLLYSAPALGGVLAGILLSTSGKLQNQGRIILGSVILYGLATIGFGMSKALPVSLMFLVMVGFGDMTSTIIRNTIRQIITPDSLRGRMSSIMRMFFQGGPQLGEIEAGFLAKAVGGPAAVVVGGVGVILITSLIAFKSKALRNYKGKEVTV